MKNRNYIIPITLAATLLLSGVASARGMGGMGGGMFHAPTLTPEQISARHQEMFSAQAALLGVSVDVVKNGWSLGKSMQQIATENGITKEQLQQKMQDLAKTKMQSQLKTIVDKGVITQAQADARLAYLSSTKQNGIKKEGKGFGGMMGRFRDR